MRAIKDLPGRLRAMGRVLWRSRQFEQDMSDEIRFHVEMEAQRLVRDGVEPHEARRQAHVLFGGVEKYKEAGRDARGRQWLDAVSLDARLGARMLVKYKGLTLIGGFAMAVAIAIGATAFETLSEMLTPALPLENGSRVVSLQYAASNPRNRERNLLHDFGIWRRELTTVDKLGAFRTVARNLVAAGVPPEPVKLAEMTASGFEVAPMRPLLGRHLLPADEIAAAPPVVVVGYRAWQTRFAADPQIVGRAVSLGGVAHTVVGVMPEGYGFPYDHQFWLPFRVDPQAYDRLAGPTIYVFGRLADDVAIEQAQAELTLIGERSDAKRPETQEPLRPVVVPYTRDHVDLSDPGMIALVRIAQVLTGALAFVVAINLAILVYARTVTRFGEIAVRAALGASRGRILAQLFVESLALSLLGAAAGLGLATVALGYMQSLARATGGLPFWIRFDLSPATAFNALVLSVVAALIMGVIPGLKATGRNLNATLTHLSNRSGSRLGGAWTTLIVAQVAVAVAVLPPAVYLTWQVLRFEVSGPGFPAGRFAVGLIALADDSRPVDPDRVRNQQLAMMSRLAEEPGVERVTYSSFMPGFAGGGRIEFDKGVTTTQPGPWDVSRLDVALDMLDVYGAEIVAGRQFSPSDVGAGNTVIVNQTFARWLAGDGNALGARFRYAESAGKKVEEAPWREIVGVVRDFPRFPGALSFDTAAVVYHAVNVGAANPAFLSVRFAHDVPDGFGDRVRRIGAEIDPALQVRRAERLTDAYDQLRAIWRYISWAVAMVTLSALLLSAAGMYALMSFTVAQRTREIGIRVALGARPRRLLISVFGRVLRQLAIGVGIGTILSGVLMASADLEPALAGQLLVAVAVIMFAVGLLAAFGPARRSLRVDAADALRADA